MDKIILLAVGGVVAVGTVLYYLLTKENEKPMRNRSRPSDRSSASQPRPRSPPISYSDVKPEPCGKRKPEKVSPKQNISRTSKSDNESGKNCGMHGYLNPLPVKINNNVQPKTVTDNSYSISAVSCRVCDEPANVKLHPCKHQVFCLRHTKDYFDIAKTMTYTPKCPNDDCREVLTFFTN